MLEHKLQFCEHKKQTMKVEFFKAIQHTEGSLNKYDCYTPLLFS